jgi:RsiW-degrading membrane proteinase PrsW (M82 family)
MLFFRCNEVQVELFALLLLAVAPGFFILWYVYNKDKYEREPKGLIVATFFIGVGVAVPAGLIELLFEWATGIPMTGNLLGAFIGSFFVIAPVEEVAKYLSVRVKAYNSPSFNEVMDGIVYSVAGALGFATIENIFYVFQYGAATGIFRAILSVPLHALCGGIIGYYLGMKKTHVEEGKYFVAAGLLIAILFHGAYDFVLFSGTFLGILIVPIMIGLFIVYKKRLFAALKDSPFRGGRDEALFAAVNRHRTPAGIIKIVLGIAAVAFSAVMVAGWVASVNQGQSFTAQQYGYIIFLVLVPLGAGVGALFLSRKDVVVR